MSRVFRVVVLCAALAAAGSGARAQAIAGVTVLGQRPSQEAMIRTVIAPFVELHAARDRKSGLLVREPPAGVCPATLGLPQAFDDFVTARIVTAAKQAGAAVQPAGKCQPNVYVLFTRNPQALVNALAQRTQGAILGFHFVHERRDLVRVTRPIQAWYVTGTLSDTSATRAKVLDAASDQIGAPAEAVVDRADGPSPYTGTGSHIPPRNSSQIMSALIVADVGVLAGREIGPVSDYIAMLSLSEARSLDACNALPSILDLMASGCPSRPKPQALTDSDIAFLKALYASDITTSGDQGRYGVEHVMAKDLGGGGR